MSQTVQLPATTTVSSLCVTHVMQSQPRNGVSCFQWVSGWPPSQDCSPLQWGHFPVPREFLVGPDVAKLPPVACSKHDRVETRWACWPVHTDDGLMLEIILNHSGTMRSSVVVHEDELGSDYTIVGCDVDVHDLLPVAYAGHHASHPDVQVCSSHLCWYQPHHDGASTKVVMFGDAGILKPLTMSSPYFSTSICKVKTVPSVIGEEYRIPIVIREVAVILCPVQTRLLWCRVKEMRMHAFLDRRPRLRTVCVEMLTPTAFPNSFRRVVAFTKGWRLACTTRNRSSLGVVARCRPPAWRWVAEPYVWKQFHALVNPLCNSGAHIAWRTTMVSCNYWCLFWHAHYMKFFTPCKHLVNTVKAVRRQSFCLND